MKKRIWLLCLLLLFFTLKFIYYSKKNKCNIKLIESIPKNSTLVIGHAYGDNENIGILFDKDLEEFLEINKSKIEAVIFTGDVFYSSNFKSWDLLNSRYSDQFKIFVAPGNHEIQSKKIFESSIFFQKDYPIVYTNDNIEFNIFIDDSVKNSWLINEKTKEFIQNSDKRPMLLIHNPPFKEQLKNVNSYAFYKKKLPSIKNFKPNNNLVVISGDAGVVGNFFCISKNHITSIMSGIWNHKDDHVLVIKKNKIFRKNFRL